VSASAAAVAEAQADHCLHCQQPLDSRGEPVGDFCCRGCEAVYGLIHDGGFARFYDLGGGQGAPVADGASADRRDRKWLEPLAAQVAESPDGVRLFIDIQGVHCAGCVWLLRELFDRLPDGADLRVNSALGKLELLVGAQFPLERFVEQIESFGYRLGPSLKRNAGTGDRLLVRLGVCAALAINSMMFAVALYLGLSSGLLFDVVRVLSFATAAGAVVVGGPVFFRSAWRATRRGVAHLDQPIALGIALAFAGSTWAFFIGNDDAVYFDTVAAFVALMLLGRYWRARVIEANRNRLLASDGADGLLCRRLVEGRPVLSPCTEIDTGDSLLIAPGELVPTAVRLDVERASMSLDWINGESAPRAFERGDAVPAGAFNSGATSVTAVAAEPFGDSQLIDLLRAPAADDETHLSQGGGTVARWYVALVLLAAALGMAGWLIATGDVPRALAVATAVLVVSCPCAFGIATSLAHELVLGGLRRSGLFVRSTGFLDRARAVSRVVFDKTGTLTSGELALTDIGALADLDDGRRAALYDLSARSHHPHSRAVRRALEQHFGRPVLRPHVSVTEVPGCGVEATIEGVFYRLGRADWAAGAARADHTAFAADGVLLASLPVREPLRPGAGADVSALRDAGFDTWILSGDAPGRVAAVAETLGIDGDQALGGLSPDDKRRWLAASDRGDTLFLGDGINDSLAAQAAHVSGTPAIDRPFLAAQTDFYFVTPGLGPIHTALRAAHRLSSVVRRNLLFAIAYNGLAVGLALAGVMKPWLAAVLMPASSIAIVAFTAAAVSPRSSFWKS